MDYPASVTVQPSERVANWRPLVHWIMLIPHFVILAVFHIVAWLLAVLTMLAVLVTGKLPAGIASFQVMYIRYYHRVLSYVHIIHDQYPPFEFPSSEEDPGGLPVAVNVAVPSGNRNRLAALFRPIYGLPQIVFVTIYSYLVVAVVTIAYFIILFTGRWPAGMRDFVIGFYRVHTRYLSFIYLLTDTYPPFSTAE